MSFVYSKTLGYMVRSCFLSFWVVEGVFCEFVVSGDVIGYFVVVVLRGVFLFLRYSICRVVFFICFSFRIGLVVGIVGGRV